MPPPNIITAEGMNMKQVITFHPDGTVTGLQVKPGRGLDITTLGQASVKRASEIEWDESGQAWFVKPLGAPEKPRLLREPVTMRSLRTSLDAEAEEARERLHELAPSGWCSGADGTLLFKSYDEAVRVEIAYLDGLRLKGIF